MTEEPPGFGGHKVAFTAMAEGSAADYAVLAPFADVFRHGLADRMLGWLRQLDDAETPYRVSLLDHCLQSATRAEADGADDETVVCALLHDVGDLISPDNHSAVVAEMLRPYVSEQNHWVLRHHGIFQGYYYFHHYGEDRDARERFAGHEHYQACVDFCHRWDQPSFDPDFPTHPIEHFEARVREVLARQPRFPAA